MKKTYLSVALVLAILAPTMLSSCIGNFKLTNKVLSWNQQVSNKFVNALIFIAFCAVPVYEITMLADAIVLNSIEFWSGNNPVAESTQIIDGENARYLVQRDANGYTITNTEDNTSFKFTFDANENSWAMEKDGATYPLLQFVDDNHVKMITPDNEFKVVELSNEGILAYQDLVQGNNFAMAF